MLTQSWSRNGTLFCQTNCDDNTKKKKNKKNDENDIFCNIFSVDTRNGWDEKDHSKFHFGSKRVWKKN